MQKRVLIVEDSDDIGTALKLLIEYEGYEAVLANRAFLGLDLAASLAPNLIIVDIVLPDMDGIELTRALRALPETETTPIVCVSSYIQGHKEEALSAGCNEVFTKTTFMESFQETLTKYLRESDALRAGASEASFSLFKSTDGS
ncbi:MAG: response regulator [bacterium]|nr:response regulator [bacterium]